MLTMTILVLRRVDELKYAILGFISNLPALDIHPLLEASFEAYESVDEILDVGVGLHRQRVLYCPRLRLRGQRILRKANARNFTYERFFSVLSQKIGTLIDLIQNRSNSVFHTLDLRERLSLIHEIQGIRNRIPKAFHLLVKILLFFEHLGVLF